MRFHVPGSPHSFTQFSMSQRLNDFWGRGYVVLLYVRPDWLQGWDDSASCGGYRLETGLLYQGWGRALYHCSYPNTVVYMCCSYTSLMMLILRSRVWSGTAVTDPLSSEDLSRLTEHPLPNHSQSPRSKGYNLGLPRTSLPRVPSSPRLQPGTSQDIQQTSPPRCNLGLPQSPGCNLGPGLPSIRDYLHVYLVTSCGMSLVTVRSSGQHKSRHGIPGHLILSCSHLPPSLQSNHLERVNKPVYLIELKTEVLY